MFQSTDTTEIIVQNTKNKRVMWTGRLCGIFVFGLIFPLVFTSLIPVFSLKTEAQTTTLYIIIKKPQVSGSFYGNLVVTKPVTTPINQTLAIYKSYYPNSEGLSLTEISKLIDRKISEYAARDINTSGYNSSTGSYGGVTNITYVSGGGGGTSGTGLGDALGPRFTIIDARLLALENRPVATSTGGGSSSSTDAWLLLGNAGTNPSLNFIGTTDTQPLVFKTNGVEAFRVLVNRNFGIGTTTPEEKLSVAGNGLFTGNVLLVDQATSTIIGGRDGHFIKQDLVIRTADITRPIADTGTVTIKAGDAYATSESTCDDSGCTVSDAYNSQGGMVFIRGGNSSLGPKGGDVFIIPGSDAFDPLIQNGNVLIAPNGGSVGVGTTTPTDTLVVSGTSTVSGIFKINQLPFSSPLLGTLFIGLSAGEGATNALQSNFIGNAAGAGATLAQQSNFIGQSAGALGVNADNSNFLGTQAGLSATNANDSNFIGANAGRNATNANDSNFFGLSAGNGATNASFSNFIGVSAGAGATNAKNSIFIGRGAGSSDTVDNSSGGASIAIGQYAGTGGFSNSISIGQGVINNAAQELNIGNVLYATGIYNSSSQTGAAFAGGKVGIGTTTPGSTLGVQGDITATGITYSNSFNVNGTPISSPISGTFFAGIGAGSNATNSTESIFIGTNAGYSAAQAQYSNFIGNNAGNGAINAVSSNFIGAGAGNGAIGAASSNFIGSNAGAGATNAVSAVFIGSDAGNGATGAIQSNFIGTTAGSGATNSYNSNFFGLLAGNGATDSPFSNFFGVSAGAGATNAAFSNFFGNGAGANATSAANSNFYGQGAGDTAINAANSNFFGYHAGIAATNAANSNFIGNQSGVGATEAANSNFIGAIAGNNATSGYSSNFIGYQAGLNGGQANNSNFIGTNAGTNASNAANSVFIGTNAGNGSTFAANSIFIGRSAGLTDVVDNTSGDSSSILLGNYTSTGGFINSVAIGQGTANDANNQLNVGGIIYATGIGANTTASAAPVGGAKVGIGTSTPTETLSVQGTGLFTGLTTFASAFTSYGSSNVNGDLTISDGSLSVAGNIIGGEGAFWSLDAAANRVGLIKQAGQTGEFAYGNASAFVIGQSDAADIDVSHTFTNRLIIDSTGNVGIGTTNNLAKLHVVTTNDTTFASFSSWDNEHFVVGADGNTGGVGISYNQTGNFGIIEAVSPGVTSRDLILQPVGGNVGIGTTTPNHLIALSGGAYSDGSTWTNASDRNLKENFVTLDKQDVLSKIASLPIEQWNYKKDPTGTTHIGPFAQDFYEAFHVGGSNTSISTIDPAGVALIGIQALNEKLDRLYGSSTILSATSSNVLNPGSTSIFDVLNSFGTSIVNGVTALKNIFVENFTAKHATIEEGITVRDKSTGQLTCITVNNGAISTLAGSCESQTAAQQALSGGTGSSPAGISTSSATSTPTPTPSDTGTPSTVGSTSTSSDTSTIVIPLASSTTPVPDPIVIPPTDPITP